jgi:membrane dipeptidase
MLIVDSHEDLAWNMLEFGRDYVLSVPETRLLEKDTPVSERNGTTMIGWPEWIQGNVAVVFAALFAAPTRHAAGSWEKNCYKSQQEASALYWSQLDLYHRWVDENPEKLALIGSCTDLDRVLASWNRDEPQPVVGLVPLMEGADAIIHPERLFEWYERGLRIIGPAWSGTAYAGGTREPGPLTPAGYELLDAMADVQMTLDLSHLTEKGCLQALDHFQGHIMVSHTNPAALVRNSPTPERFISDNVIQMIAERDGVIGLTAFNRFLRGDWRRQDGREEFSAVHIADHIDYICQLTGSASYAGIGTDFDGGLGLEDTPAGLDSVADLQLIGTELARRGFGQQDVEAVLGGNWLAFLRRALPA